MTKYKKIGNLGGTIDIIRDADGDVGLCRDVELLNEDDSEHELFYLSIGGYFTLESSLEEIQLAAQGTLQDRVIAAARRAVASGFDGEDQDALVAAVEALADSEDE